MVTAGRYIALEGSEGCGKSTQAAWLAADLNAVLTREQGGTAIGQLIRGILLDPANTSLDHRAEALLNAADRAQHIGELIAPALDAGTHVVSDRSVYSTLAYQGYGRRLPLEELRSINDWAVRGRWPELAILLEVDPVALDERTRLRTKDRFERETKRFHDRVRKGFAELAAAEPDRWVVIDANATPAVVRRRIRTAVRKRLGI
ncbi:MAG: dTMP kinase [Actinobacteria bacterium]|uniref:dTMP kinase n=1 Tax=freshwater metagenome TaxID=449393 RepID=A0A6J6XQ20_9ZZZZ|nr:dTMP kinase [Actinomycetota bacterium]